MTDQLSIIQAQLDILAQKLENPMSVAPESTGMQFATTAPTKVALYYFNQKEDAKLPLAQQINRDSLLPVYRTLPASDNIIRDTINLLLQGNLSVADKTAGFTSEFPHKDFRLLSAQVQSDGTLILEFPEILGFTSG